MVKPSTTLVGSQLIRGLHVIVEPPEFQYLLSEIPGAEDQLVCYFAARTNRFCVGQWVSRAGGRVREITSWGPDQPFKRWQVTFCRYYLSPRRRIDMGRFAEQAASDERSRLDRITEDTREVASFRKHFIGSKAVKETQRDNPKLQGLIFAPDAKLEV